MKKLYSIFFLCLFLFSSTKVEAFSLEKNQNTFVYDLANVLSDKTKENINETSRLLYDKCSSKIIVVTISENDDTTSIANQIYQDYPLDSSTKNGVLLVCNTLNNDYKMIVGNAFQSYLSESVQDSILKQYFLEDYEKENYDFSIDNWYQAIFTEVSNFYHVKLEKQEIVKDESHSLRTISIYTLIAFIVLCLVFLIYQFIKRFLDKKPKGYLKRDFTRTHEKKRKTSQKRERYLKRSNTNQKSTKFSSMYDFKK